MKQLLLSICLFFCLAAIGQITPETYVTDSASVEHAGVPKGEILKFIFDNSKIFPGTQREYWIYIPAEYKDDKPACLYVNQDGIQYKAPTVFDNLIYSKEMPVTIGVFINPGIVKAIDTAHTLARYNRSFEYDGLGNNYVRFLLEEILPEVEKHKTSDGRVIRLSENPNDRAIGGSSSGAICAFTAAWERPDAFSRVFSSIGTYVNLRGGDRYPGLIRKYEPKALRIFLQDGVNDLNIYGGDWWKANEMMERALTFSGYEVQHVWGEGSHSGVQATAIFPAAMRWLWKDHPKLVMAGKSKNQMLEDILIPGEEWTLVGEGYGFTEGTASNEMGEVFYQDIPASKTYKVGLDEKLTMLPVDAKKASGTAFGVDGKRYTVANGTKQVLRYDARDKATIIANNLLGNDLVIGRNGNMYVTVPDGYDNPGKIYLISASGQKRVVDEGLKYPNGIAFSPDQSQLYVTESASHWLWVYQVKADGTLGAKQKFGWLHTSDEEDFAWPDGVRCDTAGRIYVATQIGIQVLDQTGRVNAIIPVPAKNPSNLCFGGKDFDMVYATCVDKVYRRKLRTRGVNAFEVPVKPVKPGL
jgi:gluconolactonase